MQVRDIITGEYQSAKYTVVNVGSVFIIVMSIDGNLHRGHIVATRTFGQRLLGRDYSKKQLDDIAKYCVGVAQATIDTVRSAKAKKKP